MYVFESGSYYYFFVVNLEDIWVLDNGWINKLNFEMEEVEWCIFLLLELFFNNWKYNVLDFIEVVNGDIIFCGEVIGGGWYLDDSYNGFIVCISFGGELKWIKIY